MKAKLLLPLVLLIASCGPSRFIRPLEEKENAINFHAGGPAINLFDKVFPMPLTSITYGRGLSDELTIYSGLQLTSLAFGVIQNETGLVKSILVPDSIQWFKPGLSVSPGINLAVDGWEGNWKLWPQLDINTWWTYGKHNSYFYLGLSNWFETASRKNHGDPLKKVWTWNPQIGNTWSCKQWDFNVEIKYLSPNQSNQRIVVDYYNPFTPDKGAIGVYLGATKRF